MRNAKGATVLSQFTQTLDQVGNPTVTATLRGTTTTNEAMQYDVSNRLTRWCRAATCTGATQWIGYTYDAVGNRTQQVRTGVAPAGTTNSTYDAADQLTQTVAGTTTTNFTYDADGNQTAQGTRTFAYDLAGRMASTTSGSTTTRYTYDGNDLRLTRATGTTVNTRYAWDVLNPVPELALERNASNALIRRYVQGPTGPVTMATSATAVFSYHRDHLGSITDMTNTSGAAQWRYTYEPFGSELTATKVVGSAPANMTRFTGEYQDAEWANLHLRARQYDPATGRLLTIDPLTPAQTDQTVSAYAYVNNMPGVLVDPSGMIGIPSWDDIRGGISYGGKVVWGAGQATFEAGKAGVVNVYNGGKYAVTHNPKDTFNKIRSACDNLYAQGGGTVDCIKQQAGITAAQNGANAFIDAIRAGCDPETIGRLGADAALAIGGVAAPISGAGAILRTGRRGGGGSGGGIAWGSWNDYAKVAVDGREYAQVGNRLYTRHAVDRMQPGGLGTPAGGSGAGRSISPNHIDDVIRNGTKRMIEVDGEPRTIHTSGTVQVVTAQNGRIVITVNPFSGG